MNKFLVFFLLMAGAVLPGRLNAAPVPAPATVTAPAAASACVSEAALAGVVDSFTAGMLHVRQYGKSGRPLILIPGLGSGAWVWRDTIRHLRRDHVIYAVTLSGFDGTPPPEHRKGLLDRALDSLSTLIRKHRIDHPVLIGHSLGGTLALRFAEKHGSLLAGVVAVDGLPVFPGMQDLTADQRKGRAAMMKMRLAGMTTEQFQAQQLRYMQFVGVRAPQLAKRCARLQAPSDPRTVAEYMAEDLTVDYRPGLENITVPVLEIVPYNAPDAKRAEAMGRDGMTKAAKVKLYRSLLSGVSHLEVVAMAPSRHFVMLDQPQRFRAVLSDFLSQLAGADTP